jgi:hypothetical protein
MKYKVLPMPQATSELFIIQTSSKSGFIYTDSNDGKGYTAEEVPARTKILKEAGYVMAD